MKKILVIEDNAHIRENTAEILSLANYSVITAENGKVGVDLANKEKPDLIMCDIMMPELDGYGVLHILSKKPETALIPFIFVSAKTERSDIRKGMELGADDYLVKPFSLAEFDARVRALLRRQSNSGVPIMQLGKLSIDLAGRRVLLDDHPLDLTAREFALLEVLASRNNRVTPRDHVIEALCTWNDALTDNGLDIAVHRLRRKLEGSGVNLRTVRGLGYLLEADDGP